MSRNVPPSVPKDSSRHETVPGIDTERLAAFLSRAVTVHAHAGDPLKVSLLSGGRSNLTYRLTWGPHDWVLRRPPLGHVLETAHDMGREARVLTALAPTAVPVPEVVAVCADDSVLGAPFYVMETVDGWVPRSDEDLARLEREAARSLADGFIDTLADLHNVDPGEAGLADFGRPEGYLERQLRRWAQQLASSRSREIDGFDELARRLAERTPPLQRGAIVHGDFRLDNVVVDPERPGRPRAVLDWEMATLGDPLADLGLFHLYWIGWAGIENPIAGTPGLCPGFPPWGELAARYAARTGLELEHLDWYLAFAPYKLAVILEGIHFRHRQGLTVGEGFEAIAGMVPLLVDRGLAALNR